MHNLNWIKCEGNAWCSLPSLNLDHPHFIGLEGVYIIWYGGTNPATIYVGQGNISQRLGAHRIDPAVRNYSHYGLFVTWAQLGPLSRDGVERYLANTLHPLIGSAYPQTAPIVANLPW